MPVRRIVATADVPARHAHPKVDPFAADPQAIFAAVSAGLDVADPIAVGARGGHAAIMRSDDPQAETDSVSRSVSCVSAVA